MSILPLDLEASTTSEKKSKSQSNLVSKYKNELFTQVVIYFKLFHYRV